MMGRTAIHVDAVQLDGAARDAAWARITARSASFLGYAEKTDRRIPVLHLVPRRPAVRPRTGRVR